MTFQNNIVERKPIPRPANDIRGIWIGVFVLVTITLTAVGIWFYNNQSQVIKAEKNAELSAIAELKVNQIIQWRTERITTAEVFSTGPIFSTAINQWISNPTDSTIKKLIYSQMQQLMVVHNYQNVILISPDGRLLLTIDPDLTQVDPETRQLAVQASQTSQAILGDFFLSRSTDRILIEAAAAVTGPGNLPSAVLILRLDPSIYLFPLVQDWPTPSESAETLIVRQDGENALYLNTLRHNPAPPLSIRIPFSNREIPAVRAIMGETGPVEGTDYRGVQVVADIRPIPGTQWFMVAKVDSDEILAEIQQLGWVILLVFSLAILMTAALAALLINQKQRLFYQTLLNADNEQNKTQQEIRSTLYSIRDGVITTDENGRVLRINPVAETLTGWTQEDALGCSIEQVFHIVNEITSFSVENPVERILREGVIMGLANHTLLISRSGTKYPIINSGAPIRDRSGHTQGVVLVFRDQTTERAAQYERTLLTDSLGSSLNEIYLFDASTLRFRFANQGALNNLGYSFEQILTMTALDVKPTFNAESYNLLIQPLFKHEKEIQIFETVQQRADGSLYPVEVHLQLFEYQEDRVFLASIQDITARLEAEAQVRKSEAFLKETQRLTGVGGWEWNVSAQSGIWSDEVYRIHGIDPDEIPHTSLEMIERSMECYKPADRQIIQAAFQRCTQEGVPYDLELQFTSMDGEAKWVRTTGRAEWDEDHIARVVGALMDVTEQHMLRENYQLLFTEMLEGFALHTILCDDHNRPIDYRFDAVNPAYESLTGLKAEDIIGKKVTEVIPQIEKHWIKTYGEVALTGKPVFFEDYDKTLGRYYEVTAFRPATNQFACIFVDSTKRKEAEMKLQDQVEELRRWHAVTLGRETRVIELKEEVNNLLADAGLPPRYSSSLEAAHE